MQFTNKNEEQEYYSDSLIYRLGGILDTLNKGIITEDSPNLDLILDYSNRINEYLKSL